MDNAVYRLSLHPTYFALSTGTPKQPTGNYVKHKLCYFRTPNGRTKFGITDQDEQWHTPLFPIGDFQNNGKMVRLKKRPMVKRNHDGATLDVGGYTFKRV